MKTKSRTFWIVILVVATILFVVLINLKLYTVPTTSMEKTIPVGTKLMVWETNFTPERYEIIVYHNPDGDTVLIPSAPSGYYVTKRQLGSKKLDAKYKKAFVPLSQREEKLGRCVGLPGDRILIKEGDLYVNGKLYENENIKKMFFIKTSEDQDTVSKLFEQNGINSGDVFSGAEGYIFPATESQVEIFRKSLDPDTSFYFVEEKNKYSRLIFPFDAHYLWNKDNFGELQIPAKGKPIKLTPENLCLYKRLIQNFEGNTLVVKGSTIMINGKASDTYVPKQDYFFICNDNRGNSFDSRYFGFLPGNHISGKILKVFD
jgi:signal peptidase I